MNNYTILPFTFKHWEGNKVLLVNQSGEFIFIKKNIFDLFCEHNLTPEEYPLEYASLESKHLLSSSEEHTQLAMELLAVKLRTRKAFIANFTSLHMIVVTLRCNCLCHYCHASSVDYSCKEYDMDWDTAKHTIDMIFKTPSISIKIEYQGGEPLLNWDIIKKSVLYAKKCNKVFRKKLDFVICTNLTDVSEKQLLFCKEHHIMISTSLDGSKSIHDKHRKSRIFESSYDKFIENLFKTRKVLGEYACSPLLTITRDNLHSLREIIDHYISLGFKSIFLRSLNPYGNAVKNHNDLSYSVDDFIEAYQDALNYILELNQRGIEFTELYATLFLRRIFTPYSTGFVDLQSPSGAGISGAIYDYNGEIYIADEGRMLARMGDKYFCVGNVKETDYLAAFSGEILRSVVYNSCVENMPICSECVYQQYCGADPVRNYLETKDLMGDRHYSGFCLKNKSILDYLFSIIDEGQKEKINVFWAWITQRAYKDISLEND